MLVKANKASTIVIKEPCIIVNWFYNYVSGSINKSISIINLDRGNWVISEKGIRFIEFLWQQLSCFGQILALVANLQGNRPVEFCFLTIGLSSRPPEIASRRKRHGRQRGYRLAGGEPPDACQTSLRWSGRRGGNQARPALLAELCAIEIGRTAFAAKHDATLPASLQDRTAFRAEAIAPLVAVPAHCTCARGWLNCCFIRSSLKRGRCCRCGQTVLYRSQNPPFERVPPL